MAQQEKGNIPATEVLTNTLKLLVPSAKEVRRHKVLQRSEAGIVLSVPASHRLWGGPPHMVEVAALLQFLPGWCR